MRDLPMPGSPEISTTWPSPALARAQRRNSRSTSSSRPTSGVSAEPRSASKRLATALGLSACDADARVELFGLIELRHPIDQRQPATRGALGIVLVRLRIAEINQDAVAHVTGDKPAKAIDNLCGAAM